MQIHFLSHIATLWKQVLCRSTNLPVISGLTKISEFVLLNPIYFLPMATASGCGKGRSAAFTSNWLLL